MSLEFRTITLNDIVSLVIDYRGKTPKKLGSDWSESGIRALSAKNIKTGQIIREDAIRYVDMELYNKWMKDEIKRNDILITSEAPFGEVFFWDSDEKIVLSQRLFGVRCDETKVDPRFIYFYMTSEIFQWELQSRATGTTVKGLRQPELLKCKIQLPNRDNQRKISYILSNIENKIDVLKKLNKNLHKLSKYLYKEFYRDKVESYDDKQYVTLDDVTSKFATGLNPRKNFVLGEGDNYYVTIKNMANNSIVLDDKCASITDEALIKINKRSDLKVGDLLFSGIGTIGRVHLIDEKPTNWNISESVFTMRPNDLVSSEFLFIMLLSQEVQEYAKSLASGSVQKGIRMRDLKAFEFILPKKDDKATLDSLLIPIIADIKSNEKEIRNLTKLRDTLLPKLMSGEIDVSKINCENIISNLYFVLIILHLTSKIFIRGESMKTKIISKIQNQMKPYLNQGQYIKLTNSLLNSLQDIDIIDKNNDLNSVDNLKLLNLFLSAKEVEGCSDKTIRYYKSTIEKMLKKIKKQVYNINTDDLRKYLFDQKNKNHSSKTTIDNIRRIFSSFFSWLENEDYIIKNPVRRIHKVKMGRVVKEVLTDENLEILRDNCKEIRDLAIIELLISTGIRVGELVNLNIEDINFYERECIVFGKGESERVVYFDARTKIHLMEYIQSRNDDNPALFVSLNSPYERLGISGVETRVRELGKKSNIHKVHPHKFRRTMATNAIDKGMPIEQVQKLLGHVQIDTTMQYAMVNQNNVKQAHRKYIG